jgi:transposase
MTRRRSKLPRATQRKLTEHFVAGTTACTAADLVGVHRNSAILYYLKLRETIAEHVADESPFGGDRRRSRDR